jgi:hypothetical protein
MEYDEETRLLSEQLMGLDSTDEETHRVVE